MKQTKWLSGVAITVAAWMWGTVGLAQAGNVYWSIGLHQPGVQVGVSNAPPVVVQYPVVVHSPRQVVVTAPPYHPKHLRHDKRHDSPRHRQVTHVHHHHYHGGAPVTIVQSAPPIRSHWR